MEVVERVWIDVTYAVRQLRRSPAFAMAALVSLALGIGANTALFSVLNAVILRPLPVPAPDELLVLRKDAPFTVAQRFSYREFQDFTRAGDGAAVAASSQNLRLTITIGNAANGERATAQLVSGQFFSLLSVPASLGRVLGPDDDRTPGGQPVAVLSHQYWMDRFAGTPDIVGTSVALNGTRFTIVGVARDGFRGVFLETPTDVWIPATMQAEVRYHQNFSADTNGAPEKSWIPQGGITWLDILVRAPRDTRASVLASMDRVYRSLQKPGAPDVRIRADSFAQGRSRLRDRFTPLLYALTGMVVLVLLIACANTAHLLLARSTTRQKEIAVRLAMGAARGRLVQQLLTESFLLAGVAAAAGLLLARWSADALVSMVVRSVTGSPTSIVHIDARVLAFTVAVSVLTALLFGLAPALRATAMERSVALRVGSRSVPGSLNAGAFVIGAQVALSLLLVTGAGLFSRSLYNLAHVPLGFDPAHVLTLAIDSRNAGVSADALAAFYARVLDRVKAVPGVRSAAVAECELAGGCRSASDGIVVKGYTPAPSEQVTFQENRVSAEYLDTVGIPLRRGRNFDARDGKTAPKVAVVNDALVRRYFAGREPLGQRFGYQIPDIEIVGLIADARVYNAREPAEPMAYYPIDQQMLYTTSISVRVAGDPRLAFEGVRLAIRETAPNLTVLRMTTLVEQVDSGLGPDRVAALLASVFGGLALVLACVGLYGLISYSVARRRPEIGVRMALGAQPSIVRRAVLGESIGLIAAGLIVGLPLAAAGGRLVSGMLFGVSSWDGWTLAAAAASLLALGVSATAVPAWRASRIDPLIALRSE